MTEQESKAARIDKLLDAIELLQQNEREKARALLRELIQEDSNFEDAWLWMSVAVDSLDQSSVCLDNVLRVNPANHYAASALYRIREPEMQMQRRRGRVQLYRDMAFMVMWSFMLILLYAMSVTILGTPL